MSQTPSPELNHAAVFGRKLAVPAVFAVLACMAFWLDLPVADYFRTRLWKGDLGKLISLSEAFGYAGTALFLLLAAALLDPRGWRVVPRLALAAYGGGLAANLVKLVLGRHRPLDDNHTVQSVWDSFTSWSGHQHIHLTQSFPSAHTATAAGLACGLTFFYPRGKWLFITLAGLVALQRMHAREHYLSDVLAGAAIGSLVGILATSPLRSNQWLARLESGPATE